MKYAVNLGDLMSADSTVKMLLRPVIDVREGVAFNAEPGQFDGMAAMLVCDEERATSIISVVRLRVPKHVLRFYESKTGNSWKRVR